MKPSDAKTLLRSRSFIEWAADPIENRAWSRARATTKDAHGDVVADHLSGTGDAAHWATELGRLVHLDIATLKTILADEPTKRAPMHREGRSPRPIGVPTFLRRLLSTHVGNVLTITSASVLPPSVVAYRRGHEDAVVESLMTVSMGVMKANGTTPGVRKPPKVGVKFWAKLDFQNFFGSIPRDAIKAALKHYGYPDEFIGVVMALVEAPVVRRKWGKNHVITSKKGTEQGVAESPVLANLVPFALDEWFQKREKRILYRRYADDIFIGAATRDEVVGAVRHVQRWAREHQMVIKGVSPDQRAKTLVHDLRAKRIDLLGAEIDESSCIVVPEGKLAEKVSHLRSIVSKMRTGTVSGVSVLGGGPGVETTDLQDFEAVHEGFLRYWMVLNESEAMAADALIKKSFPQVCLPSGDSLGTVWSAVLCGDQAGTTVDLHGGVHPTGGSFPMPKPRAPTGPEAEAQGDETLGTAPFSESEEEGKKTSGSPPSYTEETETAVGFVEEADDESGSTQGKGAEGLLAYGDEEDTSLHTDREVEDAGSPSRAEGRKSHRFLNPFDQEVEEMLREMEHEFPSEIGSAVAPQEGQTPPPEASSDNVYVSARRARHGSLVTLAASGPPRTWAVPGRPEAAVVRAMRDYLRSSARGRAVTFRLDSAFLPKLLLRRDRGPRSPILYARLRELHRAAKTAGVRVTLTGPAPRGGRLRRTNGQPDAGGVKKLRAEIAELVRLLCLRGARVGLAHDGAGFGRHTKSRSTPNAFAGRLMGWFAAFRTSDSGCRYVPMVSIDIFRASN